MRGRGAFSRREFESVEKRDAKKRPVPFDRPTRGTGRIFASRPSEETGRLRAKMPPVPSVCHTPLSRGFAFARKPVYNRFVSPLGSGRDDGRRRNVFPPAPWNCNSLLSSRGSARFDETLGRAAGTRLLTRPCHTAFTTRLPFSAAPSPWQFPRLSCAPWRPSGGRLPFENRPTMRISCTCLGTACLALAAALLFQATAVALEPANLDPSVAVQPHAMAPPPGWKQGDRVLYSVPDPFTPNDPYFSYSSPSGGQWGLQNQLPGGGPDINVVPAWNRGVTGQGVTIGIVDTGFETAHEDLAANYVAADSWNFGNNTPNANPIYPNAAYPNTDDNHATFRGRDCRCPGRQRYWRDRRRALRRPGEPAR